MFAPDETSRLRGFASNFSRKDTESQNSNNRNIERYLSVDKPRIVI